MFSKFDEDAKKVLNNMKEEMQELHHPYIGSEHLFLSILKYGNTSNVKKVLKYITYDKFKDELIKVVGIGNSNNSFYLYTPLLRNILESASGDFGDDDNSLVGVDELLFSLFDEGEGVAIRILLGMNIDVDDIYDSLSVAPLNSKSAKLSILNYGVLLNEKYKNGEIDPVIGREDETNRVIEILCRRTKNNPLLIGDAGVGKTAIVENLARLIEERKVPSSLLNKKIISVSMASLVAGTKYRGEFEERIGKLLSELEENSDIILFIDEIHTLVGAGGAEGAIDASNIFKPALARGKIKVIGATTTSEYKKFIEEDKALCRRFQTVNIGEPSLEVVRDILVRLRPIYEDFHKVKISDEVIDNILYLSNKYIYDRKMPDKAIDVLDEVCSLTRVSDICNFSSIDKLNSEIDMVKLKKNDSILLNKFDDAYKYKRQEMLLENKKSKYELKNSDISYKNVTLFDVKKVVEKKSKIPILGDNNFINSFNDLYDLVIGQNSAIDELLLVTKKIKYGYKKGNKPYSFLFVGSTGTGKTFLAKEYAKRIYGEDNFIRLDMTEFREEHSISKIIGTSPGYVGYNDGNNIFEIVKDKPYSVILLDEIDKASPDVISLFLQILDEGKAKNSKGEVIRFDNTIIIMTSNVGFMKNSVGFNSSLEKSQFDSLKLYFGSEFLNRINKVIYFNKLDDLSISRIVDNKLKLLKDSYKKTGVSVKISKKVLGDIKSLCNYDEFGARRVDMVIDSNVESFIVDEIMNGSLNISVSNISMKVA